MKRQYGIAGLLVAIGCSSSDAAPATPADGGAPDTGSSASGPAIWVTPSPTLDPTKLPIRDQAYVTDAPKKGFVFVCDALAFQQTNGPGGMKQGDWLDTANKTYDMTKKVFVHGTVRWDQAVFTVTSDDPRAITANGFPFQVPTGVFPVAADDPAAAFDPNPNAIAGQSIAFTVPRNPAPGAKPVCAYKQVGITLDGVPLHLPLDSSGRDELVYQLQDTCTGASQPGGGYHRHALSDCTPRIHDRLGLVGYALDGFGIYSPYDANGVELTSNDLDECHGITSEVPWEGQTVAMYHYVMTRDFPYTIACFHGTPTRNAFPALPGAPPEH